MRVILVLNAFKGISTILWPSILICPWDGSIVLNKVCMTVDFPAPVLPTMPIFYPGLIERFNPFKT